MELKIWKSGGIQNLTNELIDKLTTGLGLQHYDTRQVLNHTHENEWVNQI